MVCKKTCIGKITSNVTSTNLSTTIAYFYLILSKPLSDRAVYYVVWDSSFHHKLDVNPSKPRRQEAVKSPRINPTGWGQMMGQVIYHNFNCIGCCSNYLRLSTEWH